MIEREITVLLTRATFERADCGHHGMLECVLELPGVSEKGKVYFVAGDQSMGCIDNRKALPSMYLMLR